MQSVRLSCMCERKYMLSVTALFESIVTVLIECTG